MVADGPDARLMDWRDAGVHDAWEIARLSAADLGAAYADGTLSPAEAVDAALTVVDDAEPVLNALWCRTDEAARSAAAESTERWRRGEALGPLDGVPATVKENLARAGVPMPAGNAGVVPVIPDRSAPVVERLTEAGAVILASTVMPDWGMLSSGVSSLHGITRSPWNPTLTTGGSSSGAGAAAAAGYAPLNVGTDIGGSIRLPGTWLGLAAFKPSAGRVPLDAPYLGRAAGPMTRTVEDAALLMSVISRPDARDWTALPPADLPWHDIGPASSDVTSLRVGLMLDAGCGMPVDPEVTAVVAGAARLFEDAGARVEPLGPFLTEELLHDIDTFWRVRSSNDFQRLSSQGQARVLPFIRRWVAAAAEVSGREVLACYHSIMEVQRRSVAATLPFDVVLSPVAPVAAFPAEWPMPFGDHDRGMVHIGFTAPCNLSGQPSISMNAGFTADGRTVGIALSGRRFDDLGVLRVASWYEANRPAAARPDWPIRRRTTADRLTPTGDATPEAAAAG
jgi:aspartyl-tRNA(Asn)/glutamyl-tRNA(Gln) amidotransferase subunit A